MRMKPNIAGEYGPASSALFGSIRAVRFRLLTQLSKLRTSPGANSPKRFISRVYSNSPHAVNQRVNLLRCQVSGVRCHMSDTRHPTPDTRHLMPRSSSLTPANLRPESFIGDFLLLAPCSPLPAPRSLLPPVTAQVVVLMGPARSG